MARLLVASDTGPTNTTAQPSASEPAIQPGQVTSIYSHNNSRAIKLGVTQSSFNLGAYESVLAWDKWHDRVGKALHKRVKKATTAMIGAVTIDILIRRDGCLTAQLLSSNSLKMSEVCINAAQALSGDPLLQFPAESKREAVRFKFEYKRRLFMMPKNRYITDDYEQIKD